MRDPARIDRIIELLRAYWKANPDLRLGQIVTNLLATPGQPVVFYVEDYYAERALRERIADEEKERT